MFQSWGPLGRFRGREPEMSREFAGCPGPLRVFKKFLQVKSGNFVIFVASRGLSSKTLVAPVRTQLCHFRRFRHKPLSFWRDKGTVHQRHRFWDPEYHLFQNGYRPTFLSELTSRLPLPTLIFWEFISGGYRYRLGSSRAYGPMTSFFGHNSYRYRLQLCRN